MDAPLIEVKDLRFSYRNGESVLNGLSWNLNKGELVALTGPSGSGKSTLFYLLGCLLDRYEGSIRFKGRDLRKLSHDEKSFLRNQEIGFVFQQFYLLPRASVLQNILLPAHYPFDASTPSLRDEERAKKIASNLGIANLLDRKPQELSGGQQQRVAIARALLKNPELILADEPTGNLDSKSSENVIEILKKLHGEGRTVVIITHSPEIANQCDRILRVRDGKIEEDINLRSSNGLASSEFLSQDFATQNSGSWMGLRALLRSFPIAAANLKRSKAKSFLTMLGVSLGVAACLTTMSLGSYAKKKILAGYEVLGVNTLRFTGYSNWRSSTFNGIKFQEFHWDGEVQKLPQIFPEIKRMSPLYNFWSPTFSFGGLTLKDNTKALGVNEDFLAISGLNLAKGRAISALDIDDSSPVCVIGAEVEKSLFEGMDAIGKEISVADEGTNSLPCRVVGVLQKQPSSQEDLQPDRQIVLPFSYFIKSITNSWYRSLFSFLVQVETGYDPSELGEKLEGFFTVRYGNSGNFDAGSEAKLISQMKLFLNVFSGLLSAVAVIALIVGGVGINNMMLANLSERLKELGLRKALGATPRQLRFLVLSESLLLCLVAGFAGLAFGVLSYQGMIYAGTKFIDKLEYEWVFEPLAFILSFVAIFITGVLSGLVPALKAERLDVLEAMRQDA